MKHKVERRDAEVLNFVTTAESYTIFVHPNLRLDVARCQNKHVAEHQAGYLWIQALQGHFVLHQCLATGKPGPWKVIFEIAPVHFSSTFYCWVDDEFERLLASWQELPPLPEQKGSSEPLDNTPDGE